jgi:hypothetical protein
MTSNDNRYEVRPGRPGADTVYPYSLSGVANAIAEAVYASESGIFQQVIMIRDGVEQVIRRYQDKEEVR